MKLQILSLGGSLFDGDVSQVSLPAKDGVITVLPKHIPLITILKEGVVTFNDQNIPIKGGFAEIDGEKVVVLAD